jgi:hypothetical protein
MLNARAKAQTYFGITRSRFKGWRNPVKILVIESDDWGCRRIPDRLAYETLVRRGYAVEQSALCLDCRESCEDVQSLFDVLDAHQDIRGRPACITGNMVMSNPDFNSIEESSFKTYHRVKLCEEKFLTSDYKRVTELLLIGFQKGMFIPQFHCLEHVRWWKWMEALQDVSSEARYLFNLGIYSLPHGVARDKASYDGPIYVSQAEIEKYGVNLGEMIKKGINAFYQVFGFMPHSTIAPNYTWNDSVEKLWVHHGIKYVQSSVVQLIEPPWQKRYHFLGEQSLSGLTYLVRNCNFEQNDGGEHRLLRCLTEIGRAFRHKRPAVVCSHRLNYVGGIDVRYRNTNLHLLDRLLGEVCRRWPDVYFLSSPELGLMIEKGILSPEEAICAISVN